MERKLGYYRFIACESSNLALLLHINARIIIEVEFSNLLGSLSLKTLSHTNTTVFVCDTNGDLLPI